MWTDSPTKNVISFIDNERPRAKLEEMLCRFIRTQRFPPISVATLWKDLDGQFIPSSTQQLSIGNEIATKIGGFGLVMGNPSRRILRIGSDLSMDVNSISISDVVRSNLDEAIGQFTRLPKIREQRNLYAPASQGNMIFPTANITQDQCTARTSRNISQISQCKSNRSTCQTLNWGEKTQEQERILPVALANAMQKVTMVKAEEF
jgi:hypothetical protein